MDRLTGHAWLLLSAAVGAAICLELISLERTSVRAGSAVAAAVETSALRAASSTSPKRMRTAANEPAVADPEPEQISTLSAKAAPPPPKLISPPVEAKRPPKKSVVAASDPAPKRTADTGMKPPAFVRTLLDGVNAVLGTP